MNGRRIKNSVSSVGITFYEDFTGIIPLIVTVAPGNGYLYEVYWNLYVTGILNTHITQKVNEDDGIIKNNSMEFNINTSIYLVDARDDNGEETSGLIAERNDYFGRLNTVIGSATDLDSDGIIDANEVTEEVNISGSFVIMTSTEAKQYATNEERYEKVAMTTPATTIPNVNIYAGSHTTPGQYVTNLPIVPQNDVDTYVVVYKVEISYMDKAKTFYVAYSVKNKVTISINEKTINNVTTYGSIVDVDKILRDKTNLTATGTYLEMFYYAETVKQKTTGTEYTLIYVEGDKFNLVDTAGTLSEVDTLSRHSDGSSYIMSVAGSSDEYYIQSRVKNYVKTSGTGASETLENISMFTIGANDIVEFSEFIKSLKTSDNIVLKNPTGRSGDADLARTLEHMTDGHWGINLTGILFSTECLADLEILGQDGGLIYKLNRNGQSTGFKLYTNNRLEATDTIAFNQLFKDSLGHSTVEVIGIYGTSPETNWVQVLGTISGTPTYSLSATETETMKVYYTDVDCYTYKLYECEYKIEGVTYPLSTVYTLSKTFYVIEASQTNGSVYKANYDIDVFTNLNGESKEISLIGAGGKLVRYYSDSNGMIVEDSLSSATITTNLVGTNHAKGVGVFAGVDIISADGVKINITKNMLAAIKQGGHNDSLVLKFMSTVTVGSDDYSLYYELKYSMPETAEYEVTFDMATTETSTEINVSDMMLYEWDSTNNKIVEIGMLTADSVIFNKDGCECDGTKIVISNEKIKSYLGEYNSQVVITVESAEVNFNIVIKRSNT